MLALKVAGAWLVATVVFLFFWRGLAAINDVRPAPRAIPEKPEAPDYVLARVPANKDGSYTVKPTLVDLYGEAQCWDTGVQEVLVPRRLWPAVQQELCPWETKTPGAAGSVWNADIFVHDADTDVIVLFPRLAETTVVPILS